MSDLTKLLSAKAALTAIEDEKIAVAGAHSDLAIMLERAPERLLNPRPGLSALDVFEPDKTTPLDQDRLYSMPQIVDLVRRYVGAKKAVELAYQAIPPNERALLK